MQLRECKPPQHLSPFINRYLFIEAPKKELPEVKIYPTGYSYITRIYGEPSVAVFEDKKERLPEVFIGGQVTTQYITLHPQEVFCHFGIEFEPSGIYRFFNFSMKDTTNSFTALRAKTQSSEFERLFCNSHPFEKQCTILSRFFEQRLETALDCPKINTALELFKQKQSEISVSQVAARIYISERQFRRRFKKVCGITPQKYQNIIQVNSIYKWIEKKNSQKLQDLAYYCGYYDIPHFIRSFKKLMGEKPLLFLETDNSFLDTYIKHTKRNG